MSHEIMVAYQETMVALIQMVRRDGFDPSRPLRMVYAVARRKGLDQLRARRHRMKTVDDEFLGAVGDGLRASEAGYQWSLLSPSERREFREIVMAEAAKLPERQQIVATCYVDCFEDVIREHSFRPLAEEVSRVTGQLETVAAVKSAWHVAKRKIAAALELRGFSFLTVD